MQVLHSYKFPQSFRRLQHNRPVPDGYFGKIIHQLPSPIVNRLLKRLPYPTVSRRGVYYAKIHPQPAGSWKVE